MVKVEQVRSEAACRSDGEGTATSFCSRAQAFETPWNLSPYSVQVIVKYLPCEMLYRMLAVSAPPYWGNRSGKCSASGISYGPLRTLLTAIHQDNTMSTCTNYTISWRSSNLGKSQPKTCSKSGMSPRPAGGKHEHDRTKSKNIQNDTKASEATRVGIVLSGARIQTSVVLR
jgi:hypothetical protein